MLVLTLQALAPLFVIPTEPERQRRRIGGTRCSVGEYRGRASLQRRVSGPKMNQASAPAIHFTLITTGAGLSMQMKTVLHRY